jgi:hypothetical protein
LIAARMVTHTLIWMEDIKLMYLCVQVQVQPNQYTC